MEIYRYDTTISPKNMDSKRLKRRKRPKRGDQGLGLSELTYMAIGAIFATALNVVLLSTHQLTNCSEAEMIPADFFSASKPLAPKTPQKSAPEVSSNEGQRRSRNSRILMGIFTTDSMFDATHRKWHRNFFNNVWKDERTCTLDQFRQSKDISFQQNCELVLTFVAGANQDPNAPTERLRDTDTPESPIEYPGLYNKPVRDDINLPDVTRLNVRENMEDGKSQTWFYFASKMATQFEETSTPIDYVMKFDSDALLNLHEFLEFKDTRLPPAPYNKNILVGAFRDKLVWYMGSGVSDGRFHPHERFWKKEHDNVHLYMAGQCYLMSSGLAAFVAEEAPRSKVKKGEKGYLEGIEDHDIASMLEHHPSPISYIGIGRNQRFWYHPVKGQPRYERLILQEKARMNGEEFEGKKLKAYDGGKSRLGLNKQVKS